MLLNLGDSRKRCAVQNAAASTLRTQLQRDWLQRPKLRSETRSTYRCGGMRSRAQIGSDRGTQGTGGSGSWKIAWLFTREACLPQRYPVPFQDQRLWMLFVMARGPQTATGGPVGPLSN